jgi:uncharacterized protein (DUF1778 family)
MAISARRKLSADHERLELHEHERMDLIGADRDAFLEAVLHPPQPTEKLVAALKRHRVVFGSP